MGALPADSQSGLLIGVVFLLFAVVVIVKGLVPRWRSTWGGWGRRRNTPMSLYGHVGLALACLLIGIGSLARFCKVGGAFVSYVPFIGFAVAFVTALLDNVRKRR
jgi:hypothetical protein